MFSGFLALEVIILPDQCVSLKLKFFLFLFSKFLKYGILELFGMELFVNIELSPKGYFLVLFICPYLKFTGVKKYPFAIACSFLSGFAAACSLITIVR